MEYTICPICARKYSVSAMRDKTKVFICEDCVRRDRAKMTHKKSKTIYDRRGYATVIYE